jgi:hypothetical protein
MISSEMTSRPPVAAIMSKIPRSNKSSFLSSFEITELIGSLLVAKLFDAPNFSLNKFYLFL